VFDSLRNIQKGIQHELPPFNDSKLTSLLRPSLINGHVSTIINTNPLPEFYDETLTVLRFSATVKEVAPIAARVDSGLQTIKRPRVVLPKSQIKKKNIIGNKNDKSISLNMSQGSVQSHKESQNNNHSQNQSHSSQQSQNPPQTPNPNTSQIIISTPLSNSMKKIIGRTSKLLGDGSIKIETHKKDNLDSEENEEAVESVLTESEVCQLVDSFEEHINKLKALLVESEVYRQQREFIIRNEMMKQIETQMGQLQEYQSLDSIKESNKVIVENLINVQDLSQLQRDNDRLISKLKDKEIIISSLGQEIENLEKQINNFKEQKKTIEHDKRKINEKLKKMEFVLKSNKLDKLENKKIKVLKENLNVMELSIKTKQKKIDDLENNITQLQKDHEQSYKQFEEEITNKFNEKKRKYEETIDDLKNQIKELKMEKRMKTNSNVLTTKNNDIQVDDYMGINDEEKDSMELQKPTKTKRKRKLKKGKDAVFLEALETNL